MANRHFVRLIQLNQNKMEKVYWTMKNGQKIDVDDMDVQHLRNTLKLIIKSHIKASLAKPIKRKFEIHGDIAQDHIDQGYLNEQEEYDPRDDWGI